MGLGTIAGQVAKVLIEKSDILAEQVGCPLVLRKVKVLPQDLTRPRVKEMDSKLFTTDTDEFFATPEMDIVIEAIGGENPGLTRMGWGCITRLLWVVVSLLSAPFSVTCWLMR